MLRPKTLLAVVGGVILFAGVYACYPEAPQHPGDSFLSPAEVESGVQIVDQGGIGLQFDCHGGMNGFECQPAMPGAPNWAIVGLGQVGLSVSAHEPVDLDGEGDLQVRQLPATVTLTNQMDHVMRGPVVAYFASGPYATQGGTDSVEHCDGYGTTGDYGPGGSDRVYEHVEDGLLLWPGDSESTDWCFEVATADTDAFGFDFSVLVYTEYPEVHWCNLQHPENMSEAAEGGDRLVFGRIDVDGLTPNAGAPILAQLGFGPAGADPRTDAGFSYIDAVFNDDCDECGDNNEYMASMPIDEMSPGNYGYFYRMSTDGGQSWTYCDWGGSPPFDHENVGSISISDPCDGVDVETECTDIPEDECNADGTGILTYSAACVATGSTTWECDYPATETLCDDGYVCVDAECVLDEPEWHHETFDNRPTSSSYQDVSFAGVVPGVTWNAVHVRDEDEYAIDGPGVMLRRETEPSSLSANIADGIGMLTFEVRKAFTANAQRRLEVLFNGQVVGTFYPEFSDGEDGTVHVLEVLDAPEAGNVDLLIRVGPGETQTNRQIVIDNLRWTSFSG